MPRLRAGRPEAAAVIWSWRRADPAQESAHSSARLRGALQALAGALVGAAALHFDVRAIAFVAFGLAGVVLLSALLSPTGVYAGLQRLFDAMGRALGSAVTWLVMLPLFGLFFVPFRMLLRRGRRDRLRRYFEPEAASYWEPHRELRPESRERQY